MTSRSAFSATQPPCALVWPHRMASHFDFKAVQPSFCRLCVREKHSEASASSGAFPPIARLTQLQNLRRLRTTAIARTTTTTTLHRLKRKLRPGALALQASCAKHPFGILQEFPCSDCSAKTVYRKKKKHKPNKLKLRAHTQRERERQRCCDQGFNKQNWKTSFVLDDATRLQFRCRSRGL